MFFSYYQFYIICKNFRVVVTLDLQLQPQDRNPILKKPNFLAKSLKKKKINKISLEQAITFKTVHITIFNKRNKMTCNFFASDFIIAPSFCHHDVMTKKVWKKVCHVKKVWKNDIYEHESKKGSSYEKINLFLR